MDSTIFNRRTLLGSGTLVGLGALLAACGQQANNEAAATASAADAEAVSLGAAEVVAAASLFACWPHAASRAPRPSSAPPLNIARRVKMVEVIEETPHIGVKCE